MKSMKTKVVALDVYGTILPTKGKNIKRKGLDTLLSRCNHEGLILCTCSDGKTQSIKDDLFKAGVNLGYFDEFFQMPRQTKEFTKEPKDFTPILSHYSLTPEELLVIGDREKRDIKPARSLGCHAILVPEYYDNKRGYDFDLSTIRIP